MDLEDALDLICNIVSLHNEERDYLLYVNSLILFEKIPSFDEFRNKNSNFSKANLKLTDKEKKMRREENAKILSSFLNKENYEEVKVIE